MPGNRIRRVASQVRRIHYYAVAQHVSVLEPSSAPRLRHTALALSCVAVIYNAAQGVRASAEPARPLVARPGRGAPESRTRAAVARSTGSTRAAAAVRPGRAPSAEGRWTPGRSGICIRAAAAALARLQEVARTPVPATRLGYRRGPRAKYP